MRDQRNFLVRHNKKNSRREHAGKPESQANILRTGKVTKNGVKVSKEDAQIRRSCKALITFMLFVRNKKIHFIVDNIEENNLFTDVERRHVKKYRLYSNSNLKSYQEGQEVEWPWKGT